MKTYEEWGKSDKDLSDYLQIGEIVDEEMVNYFTNVIPPACWNNQIIQLGEAYSYVNGKVTYTTLRKTPDGWAYAGHCFRGEVAEPK